MADLFSPINIKNCTIKNRIVMPPMVWFGISDKNGFVTEDNIKHYEARAKGGVGLIIVEATCVNKYGKLDDNQLGIWSDEHIEGLKKIADACHKHGAKILIQIHHAGLKTPESVCDMALAPSDYNDRGRTAKALSAEGIFCIEQDFVNAAIRAKKAGFDGIELHGAHGYLIDQFMSPITNKREDPYGGSIENRTRFVVEIVQKIRKAVGQDFVIGCRMGGNEPTLENGIIIAKELEKNGVDLLHVSSGISSGELPVVPEGFPYNWIVYCGTEIKKHVSIPVIVVNDIRTPERASYLIENNMADFAAIGKDLLVDAEWANKAKEKSSINLCLRCKRCQWFTDYSKCPGKKQKR